MFTTFIIIRYIMTIVNIIFNIYLFTLYFNPILLYINK